MQLFSVFLAASAVLVAGQTSEGVSEVEAAGLAVKVRGKSGKFTIYKQALGEDGDSDKITVEVDYLGEFASADATKACKVGNGKSRQVNSFASQDFEISAKEENVELGNATATKVSFSSAMDFGKITMDTYIITTGGGVGPLADAWMANAGDLKFNIMLSEWQQWCGDYVDVRVKVKGSDSSSNQTDSNNAYALGGGRTISLTDSVTVDDVEATMSEDFPSMVVTENVQMLTVRFPKFTSSAVYDPFIRTTEVSTPTTAATTAAPTTTDNSGAVFGGLSLFTFVLARLIATGM